mgnify:FL=1
MANSHKVWQSNAKEIGTQINEIARLQGELQDDIFAAVTGFERKSSNKKTGDMLQMTILSPNVDPLTAKRNGDDGAYCGEGERACPLHDVCYVIEAQMPLQVWRKVKDDKPEPEKMASSRKPIRLGAYGDPGFLPLELLDSVTEDRGYTGYSHQWRYVSKDYRQYVMASVESEDGRKDAKKKGYRTFRVLTGDEQPVDGEILCPNYTKGTQCAECQLCSGTKSKAKDICIPAHGAKALGIK